jgi:isoleucyl-tRNA synthetase
MAKPESTLFAPLSEKAATSPDVAELEVLAAWRAEGTFEAIQRAREGKPAFVFWEGPPTANGRPGIHHVFARTVKDAACRYHTMLGKSVVRKAGWDTHGLPVELEVEKKLGISGKPQIEKYGVAAFNKQCRESVWTYRKDWEEMSERIGYWLDYAHPYVTYENDYIESVWNILALFHRAGFVYRGKRVLPYCGRCGTGLSSHELGQPGVYRDVMDPSVYVRFKLKNSARAEPESILAWTTTPWTLPSNIALAVHPEREYVLARVALPTAKGAEKGSAGHELVWIVAERAKGVLGEHEVLEQKRGSELAGLAYEPLFAGCAPEIDPGSWKPEPRLLHHVVTATYVTVDDGTGIVHQAAAYGVDDWETARVNRLPVLQAVGAEGRFVCDVGAVKAGTFFKEADAALMDDLKARQLLFKRSHESHSYPHCWRCDTPLFYYAVPAWYIRTSEHKQAMLENNRKVNWIPPEIGQKRFGEWLENNIDWNISRDRYWGTPLPFWVCEGCERDVAIDSIAELERRAGALSPGFDLHKPWIDEIAFPCESCAATMRRTKSVLDCWFDSGAMPYAQYHWPFGAGKQAVSEQFPADFIAEGLDQTRGWFYTLHAIGTLLTQIPSSGLPRGPIYKACSVNGLVLDKDGVKMSKRLGNVVDPWATIRENGADAVRWYLLASGAPWLPKRFDPNGLVEVRRRFFGTLINSYKFFADYARLPDGYDPRRDRAPAPKLRPEIDRWLVSRTQSLISEVRVAMDAFDLAGSCKLLEAFVVDDLSNWYIRRNRARFWKGQGADKLAAFASLHAALETVALLLAPIAPFVAEMIFTRVAPERGSVHAQVLPVAEHDWIDRDLEDSMRIVVQIVEMGRALRERANLKIRQPLRALHLRSSHEHSLELLRTAFASEQILGELNIKSWGSLAADDGALCTLKAKANFRLLGKRLGGAMKAAAAAIEALPAAEVARLRAGASVALQIGGERVEVAPEEVEIQVQTKADFDVETNGRFVVFLDAQLDDELLAEGLARELVNRLNTLRKDSGLAIEERIRLRLHATDALASRALDAHASLISSETLAIELSRSPEPFAGGVSERFDLGDGRELVVHLIRA